MKTMSSIVATAILLLFASVAVAQLSYTDILLSPEKFVGQEVTMQGAFRCNNTERKSFDMKQGDNVIEVFYERLPKEAQASILSQENFSKTPVTVKGTLRRFANSENSYYIMASAILWK